MILVIGGCGYIGSRLYEYLNYPSTIDLEWFGNTTSKSNYIYNYKRINLDLLKTYDTVILLAGHSSVAMAESDHKAAFHNNVANFVSLIDMLSPDQKFIYMSSSSIYNGRLLATEDDREYYSPTNYYDLNKFEIDAYAKLSGKNYYGLRPGTVNGYSPNLRDDLMLNKMYLSAINRGFIEASRTGGHRPILGIDDLCRAIKAIVDSKKKAPGIYNLLSFNSTIGGMAEQVGKILDVPVKEVEGQPTYDFTIRCNKFADVFDFKVKDNLKTIIESFNGKEFISSERTLQPS